MHMHDTCEVYKFCGIQFSTSHEHVDARDSRINRVTDYILIIYDHILYDHNCHEPFPYQDSIMSVSTGAIGGNNINCYNTFEVEKAVLEDIFG